MYDDSEIIKQLSDELSVSPDEIKDALKIAALYKKYQRRRKQIRKDHKRQLIAKQDLERAKQDYPERCFCDEDGIEVKRDFENDNIIRYVTWYSPYDYSQKNPQQVPIYQCSHCGKEYEQIIAIAA